MIKYFCALIEIVPKRPVLQSIRVAYCNILNGEAMMVLQSLLIQLFLFVRREQGQGLTEYAIFMTFVVLSLVTALLNYATFLDDLLFKVHEFFELALPVSS